MELQLGVSRTKRSYLFIYKLRQEAWITHRASSTMRSRSCLRQEGTVSSRLTGSRRGYKGGLGGFIRGDLYLEQKKRFETTNSSTAQNTWCYHSN